MPDLDWATVRAVFPSAITIALLLSTVVAGGMTGDRHDANRELVAQGTDLYEINGPFFFSTADFLQDVLDLMERQPEAFILRLRTVPAVDATALNALESFR